MPVLGLGKGLVSDVKNRWRWYRDDWTTIFGFKLRILASSTYIFFASALPALAFGEQIAIETNGLLNSIHVLAATATAGVLQAVVGGQPLLIVGVAEPIILVYTFMYKFAKDRDDLGGTCPQAYGDPSPDSCLFLPWASWVCIFTALFMMLLAIINAAYYINRFTRFAGELFGMLIALLFLQQAIKGLIKEFERPEDLSSEWQMINGLWSLFLAFGMCLSCLLVRKARSWRFLKGPIRAFLADYGVPAMVIAWSGLSFAVQGSPGGQVPARVLMPNTWDVTDTWSVVTRLSDVPGQYIAAALIPAFITAILFYFDHNVSSQMAQQQEFNLIKPPAYHYDLFLLGIMSCVMGLIGVPPVNGVLPQAPMHTKSLSVVVGGKKQGRKNASKQQQQMDISPSKRPLYRNTSPTLSAADQGSCEGAQATSVGAERVDTVIDVERVGDGPQGDGPAALGTPFDGTSIDGGSDDKEEVLRLSVAEQRGSGLLQSLAIGVCLAATPALKQIPAAVLWAYFAFMALESLPGSQFWDRLLLLFTDPKRRFIALEKGHAPFLETVPFPVIAKFTIFQLLLLLIVYGITWAGIAGVLFPIPIMLLVPVRQFLMPRMFDAGHLEELDATQQEILEPLPHATAVRLTSEEESLGPVASGELLEDAIRGRMGLVVHHLTHDALKQRRGSLSGRDDHQGQGVAGIRSDRTSPEDKEEEGEGNGHGHVT